MAFHYQVEIRNKADELVAILQPEISGISWRWDALGGCGEAQIVLRRPFDDYGDIDLDYDIQIWRVEDPFGSPGTARLPARLDFQLGVGFSSAKELRWSGFIRQITPTLDEVETVTLSCSGYVRQTEYIVIPDVTYSSQDVGAAARSIIDTYVIPGTKIKRTGALSLCQDTGVTISGTGLRFFTSAFEALRTLAEIGGNAEWGVNAANEAFFVPRSTTVKQGWIIGDRVKFYQPSKSTDEIVNRVYLQGSGGTIYELLASGIAYQTGYQKERVVQVASIATSADAALWGLSYFAKFGTVQPKGLLRIGATDAWIENVSGETMPPLGRLRVVGGPVFLKMGERFAAGGSGFDPTAFAESFAGTVGEAGPQADFSFELAQVLGTDVDEQFRIDSISYQPTENGLDIDIDLGEKRGGLTDLFRAIDYKLSALRQGIL